MREWNQIKMSITFAIVKEFNGNQVVSRKGVLLYQNKSLSYSFCECDLKISFTTPFGVFLRNNFIGIIASFRGLSRFYTNRNIYF